MKVNPRIRILVVDSDYITRNGIAVTLQREPDLEIIGKVSSPDRAQSNSQACGSIDVIIFGFHSSENDGSEFAVVPSTLKRCARVLVYDEDETAGHLFSAVDAGAAGYISRRTHRSVLVDAIRSVASGRRYFSHQAEEMLLTRNSLKELSKRELTMLNLISEGMTNKEMASTLKVSPETVKFHVTNLIEKLGARDRTHALVLALRRGVFRISNHQSSILRSLAD